MSDPKRLRMLKELTTLLEGVTPANGYNYDLTGKVYRGKSEFSEQDMPGVSILQVRPVNYPDTLPEADVTAGRWELYFSGAVKVTGTQLRHPIDEAEVIMADIKQMLATLIPRVDRGQWLHETLGGTVSGCTVDDGFTFVDAEQVQDQAQFLIRAVFEFTETKGDPYGD